MKLPTPSAWRYTDFENEYWVQYRYQEHTPNTNNPNWVPMYTRGQVMELLEMMKQENSND